MKTLADNEKIAVITNRSGEQGFSQQEFAQFVNAITGEYGELITANNGGNQTPGTTPVLSTQWNANGLSSSGITPDHTTDTIAISNAGIYRAHAQFSFSGTVNAEFVLELYSSLNDTPIATGIKTIRKLGGGGDVGSCSFIGYVQLLENDEIGVFVNSIAGGQQIVIEEARLIIDRVV